MTRPAWENIGMGGGYIKCNCGQILQSQEVTREHWQKGHFDVVGNEMESRMYGIDNPNNNIPTDRELLLKIVQILGRVEMDLETLKRRIK